MARNILFQFLLAFFIFASANAYSIDKGSLRGFVTDSSNGEQISYANVIIKGTRFGSSTNNRGYYYIPSIPVGKHKVIISFMGYKTKEVEVNISNDEITQLNIKLSPVPVQMQELSVFGQKTAKENETDLGLEKITPKQIDMQPQGLEADIFKYLQSSSGVSSTGDVTSKYYVRGGGSDQNLLLLDGVTVYNPFHALGIFSVIDPDMINVMEFYKGGFPAEYGGRLSSIVNIVTKDGNRNRFAGSASGSFISGKVALEGPIPNGSFMLTGRKSYFTKILKKYLDNKDAPFDFYDLSFKVNYSNPDWQNGKFVFHTFISNDGIKNDDPLREDYTVQNKLFGVNWYQIWSSPLFSNLSVSISKYHAQVFPNLSTAKPQKNDVLDATANMDFTYIYPSKDEFRFGLQSTYLNTELALTNLLNNKTDIAKSGSMIRAYSNYKFLRYDNVGLDLGIRMNFMSISQKGPFLIEPRINFMFKPIPTLAIKAAFGRSSQEITTLSNENEVISIFEPWVIVPEYLDPPEATHYILGFENYFTENLSLSVESYYKVMSHIMDINPRKYSAKDDDYINIDGKAYGVEAQLKYQNSFMFFQVSYSLSKAEKNEGGKVIIPRYDIRNILNIMTSFDVGNNWGINASWSFNSGMPFTPIAGFYDRLNINPFSTSDILYNYLPVTYWADRNIGRLPVYHRLDLSITKSFEIGITKFTVGANIINVYNRKNIFYFHQDTGAKVYMLPFLPSLTLKAEL